MNDVVLGHLGILMHRLDPLEGYARRAFLEELARTSPEVLPALEALMRADREAHGFLDLETRAFDALSLPCDLGATGYRLHAVLAESVMSFVFAAELQTDGEERVIKLVHPDLPPRAGVEAFRLERAALRTLRHPGIVHCFESGSIAVDALIGRREIRRRAPRYLPYMALERVSGQHIDDVCDRRDLAPDERLELLLDVCDAVNYVHRQRLVHNDLKPSNILVRGDGRTVLIDFGLARSFDQSTPRQLAPAEGWGTICYASPEQARGAPTTPASDIYSLGVVLFRLITNMQTPRGPAPPDPDRIDHAPLPRTVHRQRLKRALRAALEPIPEHRPASVTDFAYTLKRSLLR